MKELSNNLVLILVVVTINAFSQDKRGIEYLVPKDVQVKLLNYFLKNKPSEKKYYAIWQTKNDTTSILLSDFDQTNRDMVHLTSATNRFMSLNNKVKIPIILSSDVIFSTDFHIVKNRGKPNESIVNNKLMASGFLIKFIGSYEDDIILSADYFQN